MDKLKWFKQKMMNEVKSFALMLVLAGILGMIAYIIAGPFLAFMMFAGIGLIYLISPGIAPRLMMGIFKVKPLGYYEAPEVHRIVHSLSNRAELAKSPEIYIIPTENMAAFATGSPEKSAIALSYGVLTKLSYDEVSGIVAHEVSHIRNNDMRSMWFALLLAKLTETLSFWGQVLLLISLPLMLTSQIKIALVPIAVLILAPIFSYLVQLTLSRINEFNADLGAAELMGSPDPLISALTKIDYDNKGLVGYLFSRKRLGDETSLFRTHPPTVERIRRLREIRTGRTFGLGGYGHHVA